MYVSTSVHKPIKQTTLCRYGWGGAEAVLLSEGVYGNDNTPTIGTGHENTLNQNILFGEI